MASEIATVSPSQTTLSQPLELHDRVAIVTGGSRGIGKAISLHLASRGAKVVVNYTSNSTQADLVVSEINAKYQYQQSGTEPGKRAISVKADVSDPIQVKALFNAAESSFNTPIYVLVNAAGVADATYSSIANSALDEFDRIFSVNTRGAYLCCKEAANRLKQGGGGRIICLTTSLVGALKPGYGPYTASKAAVEAMVKILAKELKGTKITANCVAPGPIATEMFLDGKTEEMVNKVVETIPLGRLGKPEDVAPLVGFLASDAGEWVNGQTVRVNGGFV
ncbi:NADPH-dependent aldehyde reductase-like protein, chloroplastic [Rutidosis leptorrhynchoides]|uniref:NADPH-dependent aldehyde reductase-like protein, chloroplastic n=1 Tax=Rutidosis leptorrhynchoides TaxID=125765 RepID=UPI003A99C01B